MGEDAKAQSLSETSSLSSVDPTLLLMAQNLMRVQGFGGEKIPQAEIVNQPVQQVWGEDHQQGQRLEGVSGKGVAHRRTEGDGRGEGGRGGRDDRGGGRGAGRDKPSPPEERSRRSRAQGHPV